MNWFKKTLQQTWRSKLKLHTDTASTKYSMLFEIYLFSPVVSLIHYIGNRVMVLSIRFFDGFVFWVGK